MPLHPDFQKLRKAMRKQYGKEKGDEVFWGYINKHKLDETKPMSDQKAEATAELLACLDSDMDAGIAEAQTEPVTQEDHGQPPTLGQPGDIPGIVPQPTPTGDPTKPQGLGEADTDRPMTIAPGANDTTLPKTATGPYEPGSDKPMQETAEVPLHDGLNRSDHEASAKSSFFSIPAYRTPYVAAPKFEGDDAPIIIKSIILEQGENVNGWEVDPTEFPAIAEQYKAGRQLRVNHDKTVESVIGKSFDSKVVKGADIPLYLGKEIPGIVSDELYVTAEFEANPRDPQIRTNILNGYVVAGSIGLDAEAKCKVCGTALTAGEDGKMKRECHHLDGGIVLTAVEGKEYSYVAEPAFEHTQAFPTFSAAVVSKLQKAEASGSSLLSTPAPTIQMSQTVPAVAKAEGKKAEGEGDADAEAEAKAAKLFADYKKAFAEGMKFRAESEGKSEADASAESKSEADAESEGKGEAEASAAPQKLKTDQISKSGRVTPKANKVSYLEQALHPTDSLMALHPEMREIFKAAAEAPGAPEGARALRSRFA